MISFRLQMFEWNEVFYHILQLSYPQDWWATSCFQISYGAILMEHETRGAAKVGAITPGLWRINFAVYLGKASFTWNWAPPTGRLLTSCRTWGGQE